MKCAVYMENNGDVFRSGDIPIEQAASEVAERFSLDPEVAMDILIEHGYASTPKKDWICITDSGKPQSEVTTWWGKELSERS